MSASYQAVLWNRQKKIYDWIICCGVLAYLVVFIAATVILNPTVTEETLIIRATATLAFALLHIILAIGPLCRLNPAFLPLLYNRRHLGVTMFVIAAIHGVFSVIQFHALGDINPVLSVFQSNTHYASLSRFPFQVFGFFALIIFFLMAATSHDFWLHNLGPRTWKTLHMTVYVAYALIVMHVMLGILQYETQPIFVLLLATGFAGLAALHLAAGMKEWKKDLVSVQPDLQGFVPVCAVNEISDSRAKVVTLHHERIAVFRYGNKFSAVSNVCKHQHGPLGEGRIIDGCITCPWHGYQYLPHNGSSPPPFSEKVATYDVRVVNDVVYVDPKPHPEGTARPPAVVDQR